MKKIIAKLDLFPALPLLRADTESQVTNICGGIFSILIFSVFTLILTLSLVGTFKLQKIEATQIEMNRDSDDPLSNITIAIGIQDLNLIQLRNIFELKAVYFDQNFIETQLDLFPCNYQYWDKLDQKKYKSYNLDTHYCLEKDGIQIYGEAGYSDLLMLFINVSRCSNVTSPVTCASLQEIDQFFADNMYNGRFFGCSFVILDTGISPNKQDPYNYRAYQKTTWLVFNQKQQTQAQIYLAGYQVNTDKSFLPFESITVQKGYYVNQAILSTIINPKSDPIYIQIYISTSPITKVINRKFGKIDDNISYIGGLYGIVISFFGFFVLSLNQYRYELRVSEGAFSFENGHMAREEDLTFPKYLKYVVYDWLKTLFCYEVNWKDCKVIDEARQQANKQIGVKHLLKRITHLQKVIAAFINPFGETVMHMTQSHNIEQLKNRRNLVQYCQKFTDSNKCITITSLEQLEAIASSIFFGVELDSTIKSQQLSTNKQNCSIVNFFDKSQTEDKEPSQIFPNKLTSLEIMNIFVEKYENRFNITDKDFQFNQTQLKAEEELAEAFYELDENNRMKLIKKIPLGILYRMKKYPKNPEPTKIHTKNKEIGKIRKNPRKKIHDSKKFINQSILEQQYHQNASSSNILSSSIFEVSPKTKFIKFPSISNNAVQPLHPQ